MLQPFVSLVDELCDEVPEFVIGFDVLLGPGVVFELVFHHSKQGLSLIDVLFGVKVVLHALIVLLKLLNDIVLLFLGILF